MKLVKNNTAEMSLVEQYNILNTFLTDLGYNTRKLTVEQLVTIKLAIQNVIDEINL